jgi:precorrin-6B methylase 2
MSTGYLLELTDSELARYRMMAERARRDEGDLWATAGIAPGAVVADIGCGPGAIAAELAAVVGPAGSVIAVDADEEALVRARELAARRSLGNVTVRHGDAADTGIKPESIQVAVIRHVLAHNGDREHAIVEHAGSLLRPGGSVLLVDVDLTGQRWLPENRDLTDLQERYVELHRTRGNDPMIGLRLGQLVADADLEVVEHRGWYSLITAAPDLRPPAWIARHALLSAGLATADDLERWSASFDRLDHHPRPTTIFVAVLAAIGRRRR